MGLSFHRCHGQLSRTCVPNMSCDYFNQSGLDKGKIAPGVILPHEANSMLKISAEQVCCDSDGFKSQGGESAMRNSWIGLSGSQTSMRNSRSWRAEQGRHRSTKMPHIHRKRGICRLWTEECRSANGTCPCMCVNSVERGRRRGRRGVVGHILRNTRGRRSSRLRIHRGRLATLARCRSNTTVVACSTRNIRQHDVWTREQTTIHEHLFDL